MDGMDEFRKLDKAAQKSYLLMEFGRVIAPLEELASRTDPPTLNEILIADAKVRSANSYWNDMVYAFTRLGEVSFDSIYQPLTLYTLIPTTTLQYPNTQATWTPEVVQSTLTNTVRRTKEAIVKFTNLMPTDFGSQIYEANTPFTVSMRIHDALASATSRVHYFDRYLKQDFLQLYIRTLDRGIELRLVTTAGGPGKDFGVAGVKAISRLVKGEFANYSLIQVDPTVMHGRQLRVDDRVFTLDASASDAGKYPTHFGLIDNTAEAHQTLDSVIAQGTVIH